VVQSVQSYKSHLVNVDDIFVAVGGKNVFGVELDQFVKILEGHNERDIIIRFRRMINGGDDDGDDISVDDEDISVDMSNGGDDDDDDDDDDDISVDDDDISIDSNIINTSMLDVLNAVAT
jgi:C-terminal processing protease CtpA/Prc